MSAYGVGIISSETPRRCGLLARSRSCSSFTRSLRSACFVTSYRVRLSTFRRKREEELDEPRLIEAANDFFDCLLTAFPVLEDLVEGATDAPELREELARVCQHAACPGRRLLPVAGGEYADDEIAEFSSHGSRRT